MTASSFGCQPSTDSVATYGGRAFAVAGPSTWNSLPKHLHDPSSRSAVFGHLLKTFLFSECSSVSSALEALAIMRLRYINLRFTLHYIIVIMHERKYTCVTSLVN